MEDLREILGQTKQPEDLLRHDQKSLVQAIEDNQPVFVEAPQAGNRSRQRAMSRLLGRLPASVEVSFDELPHVSPPLVICRLAMKAT